MDPLSLLAMASSAFKGIEMLVNRGAAIENVALKLGKWYEIAHDLRNQDTQKPPVFKKIFHAKSVEQEALTLTISRKKLEEQEKQIRELIIYAYGLETYQEMIALRRQIKADREATIYRQRRRQIIIFDTIAGICGAIISIFVIWFVVYMVSLRS
tara:strand:- start:14 stop:478 length:465 start_codon:yes stop_codon:yes gene_type:complete